jgi:hypothetical protein
MGIPSTLKHLVNKYIITVRRIKMMFFLQFSSIKPAEKSGENAQPSPFDGLR